MSKFDVDVPQSQDPSYLHFFHPITEPEADKSKAIALKGAGDTLDIAAKGVDETLKTHAEFLGEQMGEQEQSDYVTAVSSVRDSLTSKQDNVPQSIKDGLQSIQNNQNGRDQGHIRETEYYKNLYTKAKELRTQWPGYRDYIDKGVEKATGITPNANQYIKSMLADINEITTKADKFKEHVLTQAIELNSKGVPGMDDYIKSYRSGNIDEYGLLKKINKSQSYKYQHDVAVDGLQIYEGNQKVQSQAAQEAITNKVSQDSSQVLDALYVNMGLKPERLAELMEKHAKGEDIGLSDEDWNKAAAFLNMRQLQLRQQLDKDFSKPYKYTDPVTGITTTRSLRDMAGEKYEGIVNAGQAILNEHKKAITDHDIGWMGESKRAVEANLNNSTYRVLQTNELGPLLKMQHAFKTAGGDQLTALLLQHSQIPDAESIKTLISNMGTNSKFQGIDGMKQSVDEVIKNNQERSPESVKTIVTAPPIVITDPKATDQVKVNMLNKVFSEKEQGWLDRIQMDYVTEDGKKVNGRYAVYSLYGTPKVAAEVKRLSDTYGPKIMENYKNWMEATFSRELFGQDLKELKTIQKEPGMTVKWHTPENGSAPFFSLESTARVPRVTGRVTTGSMVDVANLREFSSVKQHLDRLNSGIESLHNVTKENTSTMLLRIMRNNDVSIDEGNSIPRDMMISIGATKKPEPKKDQSKVGG